MHHIRAAADAGAPALASLLREAEGVSATYEWQEWSERDRESAELMHWYVFEVAKEAAGDRNWLRALNSANDMVAFEMERRRLLENEEQEPSGGG